MNDEAKKSWWDKLKADVTASLKGKAEADGQIAKTKGETAPVIDVVGYAEAVTKGLEASLEMRFAALEGAQFAKSADVVSKAQLDEAVAKFAGLEAAAKAATDAANAANAELASLRDGLPGRGNTNKINHVNKGGADPLSDYINSPEAKAAGNVMGGI
jgi:hypothetical protein